MDRNQDQILNDLNSGYSAKSVATQAIDALGNFIYKNNDEKELRSKNLAHGGRFTYEKAVTLAAQKLHLNLTDEQVKQFGWALHKGIGSLGGKQFSLLSKKFPKVGRLGGLVYGITFFVIIEELLMHLLTTSTEPKKLSWKHNGANILSHVAYGLAVEVGLQMLNKTIDVTSQSVSETQLTDPSSVSLDHHDKNKFFLNYD